MLTPNGGVFGRNPKFNSVTIAGTLNTGGNITLGSGANVVVASGNGISFAATSQPAGMTSELLNDYEEGTWTPTYVPSTGSFAAITMDTIDQATYTKIGRTVIAHAITRTDNLDATGGSGSVRLSGLPFTPAGTGSRQYSGTLHRALNWAGDFPDSCFVAGALTVIFFNYRTSANGGTVALDVADMTTGATADQNQVAITVIYQT